MLGTVNQSPVHLSYQRHNLLLKERKLIRFIFDRPYENPLHAGSFICREFFGADFRRTDEEALAELIERTMQERRERFG